MVQTTSAGYSLAGKNAYHIRHLVWLNADGTAIVVDFLLDGM